MQVLSGTRWCLPQDREAVKLDAGDEVEVSLRGLHKGSLCVGTRRVAAMFLRPTDPQLPYVYCSKGRFPDLVAWLLRRPGAGFDTPFYVRYEAGGLDFYAGRAELEAHYNNLRTAVEVVYGPTRGSA